MKLITTLMLVGLMSSALVHAEETLSESAGAKGNNVKRELNKAGNRIQEATCMDGDIKCAGKKVGNRIEEAKDSTVDGAKRIKNKID